MDLWILLVLAIAGVAGTVEVHFESKDGGFFLKHAARQHYADLGGGSPPPPPAPPTSSSGGAGSSVLSVDRFSVVQSSRPVSVRASYGPFSTKQTVPARYVVPDPLDLPPPPPPQHNASAASMATLEGAAPRRLDVSAHVVRATLPRDAPVLRVLFHAGADPAAGRRHPRQRVCIVLHAALGDRTPLSAACSPDGEDGVCLAQVTVPASWWPPLGGPGSPTPAKTPPRRVTLAYSVLEPRGDGCQPRVQIQPVAPLGVVALVPAVSEYRDLRADALLTLLLPRAPLYPRSRVYLPVFLHQPNTALLVVKARVKNGLRLLGADASSDKWNVSVSLNGKHTAATVTAFRRDSLDQVPGKPSVNLNGGGGKPEEVFTWLVGVSEEGALDAGEARLVWNARYVLAGDMAAASTRRPQLLEASGRRRHTARLEVHKDDIQAVLPISKNWEVMNTAVLTGHQVSQAMKVFIVSQAGKVADVTLQSACHSEDESVLKVSSSCSSVYVDGSEIRGSSNASVVVKYGTYTGLARFTVWMPEFPLEVSVADFKLSQVKGWRVPDDHGGSNKLKRAADLGPAWGKDVGLKELVTGLEHERSNCRLRFQQSPVEVYARFVAADQDSGRVSYFVSRRTWLRVTDLVEALLRVSDPRIASLSGRILQGRGVGRSEVQVLSPITGRVIGAKEIRVGSDKVAITRLLVRVVSGLQLTIVPDSTVENGYVAETSVTRKLTAQYQEGLLDIDIEFSDLSRTPLREVSVTDYQLLVDSLNPEVVAFAPMVASHHPRVIAVGEGEGDLLRVALLANEECRSSGGGGGPRGGVVGPLASASAFVEVDFSAADLPQRPDFVQNDGGGVGPGVGGGMGSNFGIRDRKGGRDLGSELPDISIGIPLKDENNHEPTVQARQHHSAVSSGHGPPQHLTPLEIGMYVLLAAFCFAIVVFVVSCVVYASKFKPQSVDGAASGGGSAGTSSSCPVAMGGGNGGFRKSGALGHFHHQQHQQQQAGQQQPREPTTNAHDWVWLGRATLERASTHHHHNNNNLQQMRITSNPMGACGDMPSAPIDSSTYCKKEKVTSVRHHQPLPVVSRDPTPPERTWTLSPPPLPPHGIPADKQQQSTEQSVNDVEYKPPVPPHRNMGVTARIGPSLQAPGPQPGFQQPPPPPHAAGSPLPARRHHHHHHHHRSSSRGGGDSNQQQQAQAPPPPPPSSRQHKRRQQQQHGGGEFVAAQSGPPEVKRATIVGNPMFSANAASGGGNGEELMGLDDLNLGMDYDQIMEYFDNLKESNA